MCCLDALPTNRRRGSFPRCLKFMEGDRSAVAQRLTDLVGLENVSITVGDFWLPCFPPSGVWDKQSIKEARLERNDSFLPPPFRDALLRWWLVNRRGNTPNWDIASTACIGNHRGLVLIEAKAHVGELNEQDRCGAKNQANLEQIARAIAEAKSALRRVTRLEWNLSHDSHYQISNRFAWSWKIASLGVPVVLVYLGFLKAEEMRDKGEPFVDHAAWEKALLEHSARIVPEKAWVKPSLINGTKMVALIRSLDQPLNCC